MGGIAGTANGQAVAAHRRPNPERSKQRHNRAHTSPYLPLGCLGLAATEPVFSRTAHHNRPLNRQTDHQPSDRPDCRFFGIDHVRAVLAQRHQVDEERGRHNGREKHPPDVPNRPAMLSSFQKATGFFPKGFAGKLKRFLPEPAATAARAVYNRLTIRAPEHGCVPARYSPFGESTLYLAAP